MRQFLIWSTWSLSLVALLIGTMLWWRGRPERHLAHAESLLEIGAPIEALEWLDLPSSVPSTRERALLLRAQAALERGRPDQAVAPLERIDPEGPLAADVAFWKGRVLLANGQSFKAAAWFREALRLRADDIEAYRWLAVASYELGDTSSAVDALQAVTRLQPEDALAWRTLGLVHFEHAEHERAVPAYEATLRLDPNQPEVRLEWAKALVMLGRYDEALEPLRDDRRRVDEPRRLELLAHCLYETGDLDALRELLDEALPSYPDQPGLRAWQARLDFAEARFEKAVRELDHALELEPVNMEWLYLRGQALHRIGQRGEGDRDLARAQELVQIQTRMTELTTQADERPEDAEVRYELGQHCIELGNFTMAATWFQAALACNPGHIAARQALQQLQRR